jgi:ferritin-like metal-binding protein YciE
MTYDIPTITTLQDILDYNVRKITSAEKQLQSMLPVWISAASSLTLKNVLQKYLRFVQNHDQKLQDFLVEEKINQLSRVNNVMQEFVKEAREKMNDCADTEVKDASLLESIQAINHYKISIYGTAAAFSKTLGNHNSAAIFHEAELNEKQIDNELSQLALCEINNRATARIKLPDESRIMVSHLL